MQRAQRRLSIFRVSSFLGKISRRFFLFAQRVKIRKHSMRGSMDRFEDISLRAKLRSKQSDCRV